MMELHRHTQIGEDYHNLCRLCLTKSSLKLNMCLEEGQIRDIQGKMLHCLSLIVTEDDSLPKFVCYSCVHKLEDFQNFHDMCHKSEKLLQEYLSSAGENRRRKSSFEKPSASQSYGSEETVAAGVSDTGYYPLEVLIKSEAESPDPLVCEHTPLENMWPQDKHFVKAETKSSLVPPYVDTFVDKPSNECIQDDSIDSKLSNECIQDASSEYMEETSVCKVESVSVDSWMHFEGTTQEVPVGQNVPAEDSDNDALILNGNEEERNSVTNPDEVEGEVTDRVERYKNKYNMENLLKMKGISDNHLPSEFEELQQTGEQEQPNNNSERIIEQKLLETVPITKPFESKTQTIHSVTVNKKKKLNICSICNKSLECRANHSKERIFNCPVCEKGFTLQGSVNVHMRIHTKERPFNCSICKKDFNQKNHLVKHMRVHTKERPFNCFICHRSFIQKFNFTRHLRVHTKKMPSCKLDN